MGLMDILNGMRNGPSGQPQPAPPGKSGGMSPWMMALLGLLAYKAVKGLGGGGAPAGTPSSPPPATPPGGGGLGDILGGMLGGPGGRAPQATPGGGGLGDILGGMLGGAPGGTPGRTGTTTGAPGGGGLGDLLGGLLGGAGAGSVLNGGLGQVIQDMQRSGHGSVAQSWVGQGDNETIAPDDLAKALGADTINQLTEHTGMSRDDLLNELSQNLPELVHQLTPDGRLPTNDEASRW